MSHGQRVLVSLGASSLLWSGVRPLEGFVLLLPACRLGCCNLSSESRLLAASSNTVSLRRSAVEWWGRVIYTEYFGFVCTTSSFAERSQRCRLCICQGKLTCLLGELVFALSFGLFSLGGRMGMKCDVEGCSFWISERFGKSCVFWSTHSHRRLWIMSPFLN